MSQWNEHAGPAPDPAAGVLGAENVAPEESDADELPSDGILIPVGTVSAEDQMVQMELRYTTDDQLALPIFTSLERLVESCGEEQQWLAVSRDDLRDVVNQTEADLVVEDYLLPNEFEADPDE